ncbi:MAG: hypothetical protein HC857_15770, partial [Synechococcales cyanobacterium RU_4_20]|nr:hypothetical protein [Synechococcales cyanobacterium RU_4_20]
MGHSAPSDKRTHAQTHIQKHAQVKGFLDVFRSRLSQRIVLAVFSSIVAIEAIILIPSIVRREQELLRNLSALAAAHLSGVFAVSDPPVSELTPPELLARMHGFKACRRSKAVRCIPPPEAAWVPLASCR